MNKIKKKYYKRLENDLYNYKYLKLSIQNIKQDIADYQGDDGVSSIQFDKIQISSTNAFSSVVENATISNTEKLDFLEHCMNRAELVINKIDKAMEILEEDERKVISLFYIDNQQWYKVAYQLHFNERWCRQIRSRAMRKMAIAIYGYTTTIEPVESLNL